VLADERLTAFLESRRQFIVNLNLGMKLTEIIAHNLKKRAVELGYVSAIDSNGRTI
jgi:hypothetical protein